MQLLRPRFYTESPEEDSPLSEANRTKLSCICRIVQLAVLIEVKVASEGENLQLIMPEQRCPSLGHTG